MFSQLARYASQLDIEIEDAEMDIRMTYDTRGKLLLADVLSCDIGSLSWPVKGALFNCAHVPLYLLRW